MADHVIFLNDYQVSNLRELIRAIGYWGAVRGEEDLEERTSLRLLDTGDWIGELWWKLPEVEHQPNIPALDQRDRVLQDLMLHNPPPTG